MDPDLHTRLIRWYDDCARDLPWRAEGVGAWAVLVSEVMLQQTPVARVLPVYQDWLERWPTPADLAAEPAGAAIRAWGRLGYPRRALRLHAAARVIVEVHGGRIPADFDQLLALPGVGEYTAAAVTVFAFGDRRAVLDTNVRRVLARLLEGRELPPANLTRPERDRAAAALPAADAPRWSIALMELGALVCTSLRPACGDCPVATGCAWLAAGRPPAPELRGAAQPWAGTDRQCRGRLLEIVRSSADVVPRVDLVWPEPTQRDRCLDSLLADGLIVADRSGYRLP